MKTKTYVRALKYTRGLLLIFSCSVTLAEPVDNTDLIEALMKAYPDAPPVSVVVEKEETPERTVDWKSRYKICSLDKLSHLECEVMWMSPYY